MHIQSKKKQTNKNNNKKRTPKQKQNHIHSCDKSLSNHHKSPNNKKLSIRLVNDGLTI